jgi:hypothetical protein
MLILFGAAFQITAPENATGCSAIKLFTAVINVAVW